MTTNVRIPVHLRDEALSANGREHWRIRADKTRSLRAKSAAYHRGYAAEVRHYGWTRQQLTVWVTWPDRRRRDVANLMPTLKALIDGAVDARVLPDDDDRHLVGPDLRVTDAVTDAPGLAVLTFEWTARPIDGDRSVEPIETKEMRHA